MYKQLPKTKIPLLKNGNIDAVLAAMTITPERKKQIDFSDPYFYAGQSLLVKDDSSIKNVRDLNGKTALAVKGTTAVDNVKKFALKQKFWNMMIMVKHLLRLKPVKVKP